jgi:hypothetical protein
VLNALLGFICSATNGVKIMNEFDVIDGYACPTDPALATLCEACE